MLINIIIYLLVAILLVVLTARLRAPQNLIASGLVFLIILVIAFKFFGFSAFTLLLGIWMIGVVGGLYALRYYIQSENQTHSH